MRPAPLPFILEDRSGLLNSSDFDDVYDRLFLRVADSPQQSRNATTMIYNMGRRSSRKRDSRHFDRQPSVMLEFGPGGSLGNVHFLQPPTTLSLPMNQYLKKTTIFGGSLSRRFQGSDGQEYRWRYQSIPGHEWTCVTSQNYLVAQYTLKTPDAPTFHVSGNMLTIYEDFSHLAIELLASLTIMRHIAYHNL